MSRFSALLLALALIPPVSAAQSAKIGIFDKQAIVIAYYRSPQWAAVLKEKQTELEQAKRDNNQAQVQQLNAWGEQSQALAHSQPAGEATINNIMDALQPAFLEIERSAGVTGFVPCPCPSLTAPAVDVTPQLLDWLHADAATRKIVQDLSHK